MLISQNDAPICVTLSVAPRKPTIFIEPLCYLVCSPQKPTIFSEPLCYLVCSPQKPTIFSEPGNRLWIIYLLIPKYTNCNNHIVI